MCTELGIVLHFIRLRVIFVCLEIPLIHQNQRLPLIETKVDNNLPTLSHRDNKTGGLNWLGQITGITSNDMERETSIWPCGVNLQDSVIVIDIG
jgi:hypothetical protein